MIVLLLLVACWATNYGFPGYAVYAKGLHVLGYI
jgi:hypothetical protein